MSNHEVIKSAIEAKNLKLAKVLLDNLNLDELLKSQYSWQRGPLKDIGFFSSREAFNFFINYLYKQKKHDLIKKFFARSEYLDEVCGVTNKQNFLKLRKITHKNWWIKDFGGLKNAIEHNNFFMVKTMIEMLESSGLSLHISINEKFKHCLRTNFQDKDRDSRILRLIYKKASNTPQILISDIFDSNKYQRSQIKERLKEVVRFFHPKTINNIKYYAKQSLANRELFFYLYKISDKSQKKDFFSQNCSNGLFRLFDNGYQEIDSQVLHFLLKKNLAAVRVRNNQNNN